MNSDFENQNTSDFINYFIDSLLYCQYIYSVEDGIENLNEGENARDLIVEGFSPMFEEFTRRLMNGEFKLKDKNDEEIPFKTNTPSSNTVKLLYHLRRYLTSKMDEKNNVKYSGQENKENIVQQIEEMLNDDSLVFDYEEYQNWIEPILKDDGSDEDDDEIIQKIKNTNLKFNK